MTTHTIERLKTELALDARATLGECVRWDERDGLIYWVDIPGQRLHRYNPSTARNDAMEIGQEIGCFALAEAGGFITGLRSGYARIDTFGGTVDDGGCNCSADDNGTGALFGLLGLGLLGLARRRD